MEKLKIAFLLRDLGQGGAEREALILANNFAKQGMEVTLFLLKLKGEMLEFVNPKIRVTDLKNSFFRLLSNLKRGKFDFLLPIYTSMSALMAKAILRTSTKIIVSQRNMFTLDRGPIQTRLRFVRCRLLYPYADACVCISQGVADEIEALKLFPHDKIHVIYNPAITKELFLQADEPVSHPWFMEGAPPVILGVGRLGDQKDFATLIKAFALIKRDVRLVILGEGKQRKILEDLAKKLGVQDRLSMPGYVTNPYAYMKKAALFVLTSKFEGFGNVTAEALACGCNVVSTDCKSGPSEILDGGKYGKLAEVGDAQDVARAMEYMLDNPLPQETLVSRSLFFSEERSVEKYCELFSTLANKRLDRSLKV